MRNPAVWILPLVFIGEDGLERSPVQVKSHNICRSKRHLGQSSEEEWRKTTPFRVVPTGAAVAVAGWVATMTRIRSSVPVKGISGQSKRARQVPGASMDRLLIRGQGKTSLYLRKIKQAVVFAACDIAQTTACHIDDHREIPILPIQPEDDPRKRDVLLDGIACDDLDSTEQLCPVISEALISECAEPLLRMREQKRRPSTNNLTPFAPPVSRSTDRLEASIGHW